MTNAFRPESFQGSDNISQNSPLQEFMSDFMRSVQQNMPEVLNQLRSTGPDLSSILPPFVIGDNNANSSAQSSYAGDQNGYGGFDFGNYGRGGSSEFGGGRFNGHGRNSHDNYCEDADTAPPSNDTSGEPESERAPYNLKENGARILQENFEDIDVNGDNRISKKEVRRFVRDEIQNAGDQESIQRVLKHWDGIRDLAKDGDTPVSQKDLDRYIENQVDKGILHRYPA